MSTAGYGPGLIVAVSVTFVIATVFLVLRFISRAYIMRWVWWDDYLLASAWILAAAVSTLTIYAASLGLGQHTVHIAKTNVLPLMKVLYAFNITSSPAVSMSKLSVLTYYLHLGRTRTNDVFRWSTIATISLVVAYTLAITIIGIIPCRPAAYSFIWPRPSTAGCMNVLQVFSAFSPTNILSDLLILFLPVPVIVHDLRLPRKQKWAIFITLGFSGFLVILDITRIVLLQQSLNNNNMQMDYTYNAARPIMITVINVNLSIAAASVIAFKPLVTRISPWLLRSDKASPESSESGTLVDETSPSQDSEEVQQLSFAEHAFLNKAISFTAMLEPSGDEKAVKRRRVSGTSLDFVDVQTLQPLTQLTMKESIKPLLNVAPLFFFCGLIYSFNDILNFEGQSQGYITLQTVGTNHALYFAGYLFMPLTLAYWVLSRFGWRCCIITGLLVTSTGNLVFWPAGVFLSQAGIMVSYCLVGCGCAIIASATSTYCLLAGPPQYATSRLLVMQCAQAFGSTLAAGVGNGVFQRGVQLPEEKLDQINLSYLVFCVFAFCLAFWFQVTRLPETTEEELEKHASLTHATYLHDIQSTKTIWITLAISNMVLFALDGVEEDGHIIAIGDGDEQSLGYYLFLITDNCVSIASRLATALLCLWINPRYMMLGCATGTLVLTTLLKYLATGAGVLPIYLANRACQAPIWSLIFAIALQAMGKRTKLAAVLLTTASCGGGVLPLIQYAVQVKASEAKSALVRIVPLAILLILPLYLNLVPLARKQADGEPVLDCARLNTANSSALHMRKNAPRERVGWDFLTSAVETANQARATRSSVDFITSAFAGGVDDNVVALGRKETRPRKASDTLTFVTRAKEAEVHEMELRMSRAGSENHVQYKRCSNH